MRRFFSFLLGVIAGAITGGSLALLLTPVRGSEVRERIHDSFVNVRDEVKTAASTKAQDLKQELARLQNKPTA